MRLKINLFYSLAAFIFISAVFLLTNAKTTHAYNSLYFTAVQNGTLPSQQDSRGSNNPATVTIANNALAGGQNMVWWMSAGAPSWLNESMTCHGSSTGVPGCSNVGSLAPGQSDTFNVLPNTTNLSPGTYTATLTYTAQNTSGSSAVPPTTTVSVSYIINAAPPSTCNINVTSSYNGNANTLPTGGFTYSIVGPSTINGSNQTGGSPWPVTAGTAWTMNVGTYSGSITFTGYSPAQSQTCAVAGGSITFNLSFQDSPPGPPSNPIAQNTSINPNVACTHITISWTAGTGPITSYYLYRSPNTSNSYQSGNPWIDTGSTSTSYDYVPPLNPGYYYWVASHNSAGAGSTSALAGPTAQVEPTPCAANFGLSNKVVTQINSKPYPITTDGSSSNNTNIGCIGGQTGNVPQTIRNGDTVTWSLNLCNNGSNDATNIVLTDSMINLTPVPGTYSINFSKGPTQTPTPTLTGNCATGSCNLTFNIAKIKKGENALLTFNSTVTNPIGATQALNRFANHASFSFSTSLPPDNAGCIGVGTDAAHPCVLPDPGYMVFFNGSKAPTQTEINP